MLATVQIQMSSNVKFRTMKQNTEINKLKINFVLTNNWEGNKLLQNQSFHELIFGE